jgi:hypothetical protein
MLYKANIQHATNETTEADRFDKCVICWIINKFNLTEGQPETLKALFPVLKNKINFQGNKRAL